MTLDPYLTTMLLDEHPAQVDVLPVIVVNGGKSVFLATLSDH